jgi:tetratricopeptide (TPR) repeat protein
MLVVAFLLAVVARPARADDLAAARAAYKNASQHFKLGEYEPALEAFKEAYRLREDPSFLFNIGQCHRLLGQRTEAIAAFHAYLNDAKHAPNRADVEAIIEKLRAEVADEEERQRQETAAAVAAAQPTPVASVAVVNDAPAPRKTPVYKKWWLWTTVGVVAVGLGVGLGVGLTRSAYPHASSTDGAVHF